MREGKKGGGGEKAKCRPVTDKILKRPQKTVQKNLTCHPFLVVLVNSPNGNNPNTDLKRWISGKQVCLLTMNPIRLCLCIQAWRVTSTRRRSSTPVLSPLSPILMPFLYLNLAVLNAKKQASIRKKKTSKPQPLIKPEELAKKPSTSTPNSP